MAPGDGLRVKGELDEKKRFQIYAIEARSTQSEWDIFPTRIGVVDHVNKEKQVLHFIVDQTHVFFQPTVLPVANTLSSWAGSCTRGRVGQHLVQGFFAHPAQHGVAFGAGDGDFGRLLGVHVRCHHAAFKYMSMCRDA